MVAAPGRLFSSVRCTPASPGPPRSPLPSARLCATPPERLGPSPLVARTLSTLRAPAGTAKPPLPPGRGSNRAMPPRDAFAALTAGARKAAGKGPGAQRKITSYPSGGGGGSGTPARPPVDAEMKPAVHPDNIAGVKRPRDGGEVPAEEAPAAAGAPPKSPGAGPGVGPARGAGSPDPRAAAASGPDDGGAPDDDRCASDDGDAPAVTAVPEAKHVERPPARRRRLVESSDSESDSEPVGRRVRAPVDASSDPDSDSELDKAFMNDSFVKAKGGGGKKGAAAKQGEKGGAASPAATPTKRRGSNKGSGGVSTKLDGAATLALSYLERDIDSPPADLAEGDEDETPQERTARREAAARWTWWRRGDAAGDALVRAAAPYGLLSDTLEDCATESGRLLATGSMGRLFWALLRHGPRGDAEADAPNRGGGGGVGSGVVANAVGAAPGWEEAPGAELLAALYLTSGRIAPAHEGAETGVGDALLQKACAGVLGTNEKAVREGAAEYGDLGAWMVQKKRGQRGVGAMFGQARAEPHTILSVLAAYRRLSHETRIGGSGSVERKVGQVSKLLRAAQGTETGYLVRGLRGKLRIGIANSTILTSLAHAAALERLARTPADALTAVGVPRGWGASGAGGGAEEGDVQALAALGGWLERGDPGGPSRPVAGGREVDYSLLAALRDEKKGTGPNRLARLLMLAEAEVKRAYGDCPSFDSIVPPLVPPLDDAPARAWGPGALSAPSPVGIYFVPGVPVQPMLAKATTGVQEVLDKFGDVPFTCEYKYDGERAQVHAYPDAASPGGVAVKVFSRNSEDVTARYPEVGALFRPIIDADGSVVGPAPALGPGVIEVVLDCECCAWDATAGDDGRGRVLPFQELSRRGRGKVDRTGGAQGGGGQRQAVEVDRQIPVALFAFDCLHARWADGKEPTNAPEQPGLGQLEERPEADADQPALGDPDVPLLRRPLWARRAALRAAIVQVEDPAPMVRPGGVTTILRFCETRTSDDVEELNTFLDDAVAMGTEGLIVKTLADGYEPSKRSQHWLKLKKDYMDGVGDTIDAVVIGAWLGKGKRTGVLGSFMLALYDRDSESYQCLGKVGTGFSEAALEEISRDLRPYIRGGVAGVNGAEGSVWIEGDGGEGDGDSGVPDAWRAPPTRRKDYDTAPDKRLEPDVWIDPKIVLEIKCADLTLSLSHRAARGIVPDDRGRGISVRFPRLVRFRPDKRPEDSTSPEMLAEMFQNQKVVQNKQGNGATGNGNGNGGGASEDEC